MATRAHPKQIDQGFNSKEAAVSSLLLRDTGGDEGGTLAPGTISRRTDNGLETLPIIHPDRIRPEYDFPKAWHHFMKVLKDKENTEELIAVFDALPWRAVGEEAAAFLATPKGKAVYQAEPYLPEILDNHAELRKTPKGSFAHAYCDFMEREGLTAEGLVEASGDTRNGGDMLKDGVEWYGDRLRDTHDILHILTGYERDTLGEQCLLSFLFHQRPSPGHMFLAAAGTLLMRVKLRSRAPILRAFMEGRRNGKKTKRIAEQSITELLPMPLVEVRKKLNVSEPTTYYKTLKVFRSEGIDPHAFLAAKDG